MNSLSAARKTPISQAMPEAMPMGSMEMKIGGRYRITAHREGEEEREVADWFENLITNAGLDRLCGSGGATATTCCIGTGSTAPVPTDTQLAALLSSTTNVNANISGNAANSPYYATHTRTWQFTPGQATGNLAEIGVGWAANQLLSRALIKDGVGNPTTITILAQEYLNVSWECRLYPPTVDTTFSSLILGTTYNVVGRAMNVTTASDWNVSALLGAGFSLPTGSSCNVFDGAIGVLIGAPSGSTSSLGAATIAWNAPYTPGSFQRQFNVSVLPNDGNIAGGIAAFSLRYLNSGNFQFGVTPKLPKDTTKSMTMSFVISLASI